MCRYVEDTSCAMRCESSQPSVSARSDSTLQSVDRRGRSTPRVEAPEPQSVGDKPSVDNRKNI